MLSKNLVKKVHQLSMKKYRDQTHQFVAEGPKVCRDLLGCTRLSLMVCTDSFDVEGIAPEVVVRVSEDELRKVSLLQHPQQVLCVFDKIEPSISVDDVINNSPDHLTLLLDGVQDPGNMGTIIRIADWFGVENIVCSHQSADVWNPKVVQATMGSIARVNVFYADLQKLLAERMGKLPVYGTFLDGKDIYNEELSQDGIIVMGNEGNGISEEVGKLVNRRLYVPNFPKGSSTTESLNVAVCTGIVCAEFRRR